MIKAVIQASYTFSRLKMWCGTVLDPVHGTSGRKLV